MRLSNSSKMVSVGELRYIQWRCEQAPHRNPDALVGAFLSLPRRVSCIARGKLLMPVLRANPFYHYLLARTKYYDEVFLDAVRDSVACIVNVGCGTDTRAYRFAPLLRQRGVTVFECDQAPAIQAKRAIARQHWSTDHIRYVELDLHDIGWPGLARLLDENRRGPVLVLMEGVSPYIAATAFEAFLRFLAARLDSRSSLAYDFKLVGAAEDFALPVEQPFRLSAEREQVAAYHAALGLELERMQLSSELSRFDRDCLLRLRPTRRAS